MFMPGPCTRGQIPTRDGSASDQDDIPRTVRPRMVLRSKPNARRRGFGGTQLGQEELSDFVVEPHGIGLARVAEHRYRQALGRISCQPRTSERACVRDRLLEMCGRLRATRAWFGSSNVLSGRHAMTRNA